MGKPIFDVADTEGQIRSMIERKLDVVEDGLAAALSRIGEECVSVARVKEQAMPKDFKDQTGNLRSSYGYAVVRDGETTDEGMTTPTVTAHKRADKGATGQRAGRAYLDSVRDKSPRKGLSLVVVAGMGYAKYVQAKGLDVLNSSELVMRDRLKSLAKVAKEGKRR